MMQTAARSKPRLPLAIIVALVESRNWQDACDRYPGLFNGWTMTRYYDERGDLLCLVTDAEHEARH